MAARKLTSGTANKVKYLMGICQPTWKENATKVEIFGHEYDHRLHMFFRTKRAVFAHDPEKKCKTGDTILVRQLPEKMTRLITHEVVDVIYPLGDVTDPITGKKVAAGVYRDEIKIVNEAFGKSKTGFDYDTAPPRGDQEGIRDFTDKPTYKKYHEEDQDPHAL
ncbi:unnamed protein product [Trichogramma brassicae]|uniref:28S ribosomal protein S17, mitochondrial n=1 Tax=Trichogramma brassicae TaxID=86971 RepID=A0A6H5ID07_9HYME|nr:unnamed protein product [Trichogramma brassicae]